MPKSNKCETYFCLHIAIILYETMELFADPLLVVLIATIFLYSRI